MSPEAGWLLVNEIVPRLRSSIPVYVRPVGSEDEEELVQDGTALAARLLHSAEAQGTQVTAGTIAYYAIKHLKSGRRSTGFRKTDPLHPAARLHGRARLHSLDESIFGTESDDEPMTLGESLASESDDPAIKATRGMDWNQLEAKLDGVTRAILRALADGEELTRLVPMLRKSRSSLQNHKNRLAELVKEGLGSDIVRLSQERALWRINLDASREKLACRRARRAA
jgi:hypothetical protein